MWAMPQPPQWLGLMRTCRQTYREANSLPYTLNSFSDIDLDSFNNFFVSMNKYRKKVDTIRLQVTMGQAVGWEPESVQSCNVATVLPSVKKVVVYCLEGKTSRVSPEIQSIYSALVSVGNRMGVVKEAVRKWLRADEGGLEVEFVQVKKEE